MAEFVPPVTSSCGLFPEWSFVKCTATVAACPYLGSGYSSCPADHNVSSYHVDFEPMAPNAQQQERRDIAISSLNLAIEVSNLAKEFCSITPAKPVFGSFSVILTMIKVRFFLRCVDGLHADRKRTGIDDERGGLRRTWARMRRRLYRPQPGVEREVVEGPQRSRERGD
jgi:hypothetical protein